MWDYSDKVKDHFLNPRNVGEIETPDLQAEVGSMACGDALRITIKVDDQERIVDARFKTFGCASAIASSSALTEMIKGLTVDEASKITNRDIADYLDGLPEEKMHCSVMGMEALEKAIATYRGIELPADEHEEDEGHIVCHCFGVTDAKIARVVRDNKLTTVDEVTHYCKAGGGCRKCHPDIEAIIAEVWAKEKQKEERRKAAAEKRPLTNIQKMKLIEDTIEREIRPPLRLDGGDIELVDINGDRVMVSLRGACAECRSSGYTLKMWVELKLREFVVDTITVEEVR